MNKPMRLILIDDHEMVLQGLTALLSSQPYIKVVKTYSNGNDAINEINSTEIDIVLSDINMPVINGFDTASGILKIKPQTKVVLLSMEISEAYIQKAKAEGIKGYVSKRAPIEDLCETLKNVYLEKQPFELLC